jgi:hypothetical protein
MDAGTYLDLKREIIERGYADDVTWAEGVGECPSADDFQREHAFVVCNSGMRAQVAVPIFRRVQEALGKGAALSTVFGHEKKCEAIQYVYDNRERLFEEYKSAEDRLAYLETLPHIGPITKYHLAKNFGVDCVKPDRHLVRVARMYETTPDEMCRRLHEELGDRIGLVDLVIWRAGNLGLI